MSYNPQTVLYSVDHNPLPIMAFMSLCLVCTFSYEITAFRTARRHKAYASPLAAMGWFGIHDTNYVLLWNKWFYEYDHWWLKSWAVTLIFTAALQWACCYQVYKYGREELMPTLTQRQFGLACIGQLLGMAAVWVVVKSVLDDDLWLISFALTAMWTPMWTTALLAKRQSLRGQTRSMGWLLVFNSIGMCGAWFFLDPWFRQPPFIALAIAMVGWPVFNVGLMRKYPPYLVPANLSAKTSHQAMAK